MCVEYSVIAVWYLFERIGHAWRAELELIAFSLHWNRIKKTRSWGVRGFAAGCAGFVLVVLSNNYLGAR